MDGQGGTSILYEPLNANLYEFRILRIIPDPDDSPIRCLLTKASLIEQDIMATYIALSYCWGDPNVTEDITVNAVPTPITVSLHNSIWYLRALQVYEIWADALCINQKDEIERGLQVRFMKRIYQKAKKVIAWVGLPTRNRIIAMKFLDSKSSSNGTTLDRKASKKDKAAVFEFFELPYWKRVWIIQEIAVGSSVSVLCGDYMMEWGQLATVDRIRPAFKSIGWLHVNQVRSFRKTYQQGRRLGLIEAMQKSHNALSSDPRDKIYALLGLTRDGDDLVPYPNYKQNIGEVLRDFTRAVIKSKKSLDYLYSIPLAPFRGEGVPNWTLDWVGLFNDPKALFDRAFHSASGFNLADWLTEQMALFNGASHSESDFNLVGSPDANILRVRGEILCTIYDTISLPSASTTPKLRSPAKESLMLYYRDSEHISHAICACLSLMSNDTIFGPNKIRARTNFFSYLWAPGGGLSVKGRDRISKTFQGPPGYKSCFCLGLPGIMSQIGLVPPGCNSYLGLELPACQQQSGHIRDVLEKRRNQEIALINWLKDIGSVRLSGKKIKKWMSPLGLRASISNRLMGKIVSNLTGGISIYSSFIWTLSTIVENRMNLVITKDGIIGTACATVRSGDIVCLLKGTTCVWEAYEPSERPIILRKVKMADGRTVYKVVGGIFLAVRDYSAEKYPSRKRNQVFDIA